MSTEEAVMKAAELTQKTMSKIGETALIHANHSLSINIDRIFSTILYTLLDNKNQIE